MKSMCKMLFLSNSLLDACSSLLPLLEDSSLTDGLMAIAVHLVCFFFFFFREKQLNEDEKSKRGAELLWL